MKKNSWKGLIPGLFFIAVFSVNCFAADYTVGYGLVFSINELNSGEIDSNFSNLAAGGHSSYFYIEKKMNNFFALSMSPGAMNFENGNTQFHVQYNILSANFKMNSTVFPVVGLGLGGCIATLSEGQGDQGDVQSGYFVRNATFLWMCRAGLGYNISERLEIIMDGRAIGFFDSKFKNLTSFNTGFAIGYKL